MNRILSHVFVMTGSCLAIALSGAMTAAAAYEVSFSGGFTGYSGSLENQSTYFSGNGWDLAPPATNPTGPLDAGGVGNGAIVFPSATSSVEFSRYAPVGQPGSAANTLAFTPAAALTNLNVGDVFKIGTFTFTNGGWFGNHPDTFFDFEVQTVSSQSALNGHLFKGRIELQVTGGCVDYSTCGTADPVQIAALNADYFFLEGHPETALLGTTQVVGVYEADFLPSASSSNTGSVDFYVKIGSLKPYGFFNPQGGAVVAADVPVPVPPPPSHQIAPNPNPSGNEIVVEAAGENNESFENSGIITVQAVGTLTNTAPLTNHSSGTITNHGTFVNTASGTLNSEGLIENLSGATFTNAGAIVNNSVVSNADGATFTNSGTFSNADFASLRNAGRFMNTGTLTNSAEGYLGNAGSWFENSEGGTFDNRGRFENSDGQGGNVSRFTNNGTASNSGTVHNETFLYNVGSFSNSGSIQNLGLGYLSNDDGGVLQNSGSLENDAELVNASTLQNAGPGAQILNLGYLEVISGGTMSGDGLYRQTAGSTIVDGSMTQGRIEIEAGTLRGSGTLGATDAPVLIGAAASLNPGNWSGTLLTVLGDLSVKGTIQIEIAGQTLFDHLAVSGDVHLDGATLAFFFAGFTPAAGQQYAFLTGANIFGFDTIRYSVAGAPAGLRFDLVRLSANQLALDVSAVPVPAAGWLFATGLAAIGLRRRVRGSELSPTCAPRVGVPA